MHLSGFSQQCEAIIRTDDDLSMERDMNRQQSVLEWARRVQAIAQSGLAFSRDHYDIERYEQLVRIAAEMAASASGLAAEPVAEILLTESGYATPKVDVRGVVFQDDTILLVRERSDGLWTLPGGWADVGESPSENVTKEIREESGFITRPVRLLALLDRSLHPHEPQYLHHLYKIFIECEIVGGAPAVGLEISEVGFFSEGDLPPLSLARVTLSQIERMFEHHRHPEWVADFV
jgi:ADP-ribose pyrophosphatase YjhB (NUDIX family)